MKKFVILMVAACLLITNVKVSAQKAQGTQEAQGTQSVQEFQGGQEVQDTIAPAITEQNTVSTVRDSSVTIVSTTDSTVTSVSTQETTTTSVSAVTAVAPVITAPKTYMKDELTEITEGTDSIGHYIIETKYEQGVTMPSKTGQNWTMAAAVGTQFYIGENDWKAKFGDWLTIPSFDMYFNKWVTPSLGLGIGLTYSPMSGLYQITQESAAFKTDIFYKEHEGKQLYRQKTTTFNPFILAFIDLDNLFGGYKAERFYNIVIYGGGGAIMGQDDIRTRWGTTFNMGIQNIFRVGKVLDLTLNIRGSLVSDSFDGESQMDEPQTEKKLANNSPFDGTLGITAGVILHLGSTDKTKDWKIAGSVTKTYTDLADAQAEVKTLKEELAKTKEENKVLQTSQMYGYGYSSQGYDQAYGQAAQANGYANNYGRYAPNYGGNAIQKANGNNAALWFHIQFKIDKWDISTHDIVNLKSIADAMKASPSSKYAICGYADKQTASRSHNLELSKNRADVVFKVLTEQFDVNPRQLVMEYHGGVDQLLYNQEASRCVIIKELIEY